MKLILTRHGETDGNKNKIHEGNRLHGKLSKKGKEQAKKLSERLKHEKINAIFSSDLRRAKQTLKEIAKYHKGIPIKFLKELREIDVGSFTGKKYSETDWNNPPKNRETYESVQKRAKKAIDKIYKKYPLGTVLFVAHSFLNKVLITIILEKDLKAIKDYHQGNTAVNILEIREDKKHKIHLLNCIKHLN